MGSAHGGVVTARSGDGVHVDDDGFILPGEGELAVKDVTGRDLAAGAVDMDDKGGHGIVIGGLADLKDKVVHHAGAQLAGDLLGNQAVKLDLGDPLLLGVVPLDQFLFEHRGGVDEVGFGNDLGFLGEEEEVGGQTGPEQNQPDDEDEAGATHGRGKNGAEP